MANPNCIIKCSDLDPAVFAVSPGGKITLNTQPYAITNGVTFNPDTGVLTSNIDGVIDSEVIYPTQLKGTACGGDVTPADIAAQYNPVYRASDGTLWTKVDAKSSAGYDQTSAGSCPNISIAAGTAGGIGIDGNYGNGIALNYTNNTCYDVKLRVGFTFSSNILINAGSLITSGIEMSINGGAFSLIATHEGQISAGQYRLNSPQYRETFFTVSPSTTINITTRQKVYDNTSNNNSTMSCWSNELRFDWTTM